MRVVIDEREISLYGKCLEMSQNEAKLGSIQLSKQVLNLGDILIQTDDGRDLLLIERKTFADLLASIKDGRYAEQSHRLVYSSGYPPHSIIYLIEGIYSQIHKPMEKQVILSSMTSVNVFKGFSVHRTSTVSESAEWIMSMAYKIGADIGKGKVPYWRRTALVGDETVGTSGLESTELKGQVDAPHYSSVVKKVKKDNVTPDNIGEIILCQIPSVNTMTAVAIMKQFTSFPHFMDELKKNPACIDTTVCVSNGKTRKVSKTCLANIKSYLLAKDPSTA
jgi:ERCC4-type nuclease